MRVTIISAFFPPAHLAGGPVQTLGAMVSTAPLEASVDVVTSGGDLGKPNSLDVTFDSWCRWHDANVMYVRSGPARLIKALLGAGRRKPDYVYVNSFFDVRYSLLPNILVRIGVFGRASLVVAPRGEFSSGALALKARKKRVFIVVKRVLGLNRRIIWHASTDDEATDIRRVVGQGAQVVVRINDTQLPSEALKRRPRGNEPFQLVFASRLSQKKRLDVLLQALQSVSGEFELRVVGAFESEEYERKCRALANSPTLSGRVHFVGPLSRSGVLGEFSRADAFAFPTAGENFGHVIGEALSQSCPVISSDRTPWSSVIRQGGLVVANGRDNADGFANALEEFIVRGPHGWEVASVSAGQAYDKWVHRDTGPHLFEMLDDYRM